MAEIYGEETLLSDSNAKPIEVVPEMLDYEFIADCESADELRAVLKALKSGEYGRYPDLENTARTKLIELLPENEKRKILAMTTKSSVTDVNVERESLQDFLGDMSQYARRSGSSLGTGKPSLSTAETRKPSPRAVTHMNLVRNATPSTENSTSPKRVSEEEAQVFRKEKLSTKEYFDRWDKYDVDAALESDDETEIEQKDQIDAKDAEKEKAKNRRENELSELQESLAELTLAERKFMSVRECEKGNEYCKAGEIDESISCYSKSIILDESNVKSYTNRAAVSIRQSNFDRAIEDCTKAIEIDPTFLKALARRGMSYHKAERYEEAVVDFEACHEVESDAGYDILLQRSKEKIHERSKKFHTMVIDEVGGLPDSNGPDNDQEEYDHIEDFFTPGALEAEQENKLKVPSSFSTNLKALFSENSRALDRTNMGGPTHDSIGSSTSQTDVVVPNRNNASQTWHKISIVEHSDSDEETVQEATISMRRIDIVEETDSEGEEDQHALDKQDDSHKLKEEGNSAMKHRRYGDAVKFYSLALDVNPYNTDAFNNRSIAHTKLKNWEKSIADASSCLKIEPNNTKALYRRGFGKMMQSRDESNTKEALDDFQLALSNSPPKEQIVVLSKKVDECQKILSYIKESQDLGSKATEKKKKVKSHDTQALAF